LESINEYIPLLQVAAVTAVACMLIVSLAGEMFSLEDAGEELGSGKKVFGTKYKGFWASTSRGFILILALFLAVSYAGLLGAIVVSTTGVIAPISVELLSHYFAVVVSVTILMACWLAGISCGVRYMHMRGGTTK
jgi:hypothetical protein